MLEEDEFETIRLIAWNPKHAGEKIRDEQVEDVRRLHALDRDEKFFFVEIERGDSSDFTERLCICGRREDGHRIFSVRSVVVANSIAGLLIHIEQTKHKIPHVYFHWTEVAPAINVLRFIFLGEGDTAPLTHEVLRKAVPDRTHRPIVHVA